MTGRLVRVLVASSSFVLLAGLTQLLPVGIASAAVGPPTFATTWGTFGGGNSQFFFPSGIAVDGAGNVYVADTNPIGCGCIPNSFYRIDGFTSSGSPVSQNDHTFTGYFGQEFGIAVDGSGEIFIADPGQDRTIEMSYNSFVAIESFYGVIGSGSIASPLPPGSGNGQFNSPSGVAVDGAGNVYVADTGNNRIQKFNDYGTFLAKWGSFGLSKKGQSTQSQFKQLNQPVGIAIDGAGNVYVADTGNNRIVKFTSSGAYLTQWGSLGSGNGQFNHPYGVAVDDAGNVYVADSHNNRIEKFTSSGTYLTQWGSGGVGPGQFDDPTGVAVTSDGLRVYVTDDKNYRVEEFTYPASNTRHNHAPATTRTRVGSSARTQAYGQPVTFTATINWGDGSSSSGTVAFYDGTKKLGTGILQNRGRVGRASITVKSLTVGSHPVHARYGGNAQLAASVSGKLTETVKRALTSTRVVSSANPTVVGQSVTFTATVTVSGHVCLRCAESTSGSSVATGNVQFFVDGIAVADFNGDGVPDITVKSLGVGTHTITATYMGTSDFAGSVSQKLLEMVTPSAAPTTTTTSPTTTTTTSPAKP